MSYLEMLATVAVAATVVIAYALVASGRRFSGGSSEFGLDVEKLKVTCKVPCQDGTISKTCLYREAEECRENMIKNCEWKPPKTKQK